MLWRGLCGLCRFGAGHGEQVAPACLELTTLRSRTGHRPHGEPAVRRLGQPLARLHPRHGLGAPLGGAQLAAGRGVADGGKPVGGGGNCLINRTAGCADDVCAQATLVLRVEGHLTRCLTRAQAVGVLALRFPQQVACAAGSANRSAWSNSAASPHRLLDVFPCSMRRAVQRCACTALSPLVAARAPVHVWGASLCPSTLLTPRGFSRRCCLKGAGLRAFGAVGAAVGGWGR